MEESTLPVNQPRRW
jgi:hypothetical protein